MALTSNEREIIITLFELGTSWNMSHKCCSIKKATTILDNFAHHPVVYVKSNEQKKRQLSFQVPSTLQIQVTTELF